MPDTREHFAGHKDIHSACVANTAFVSYCNRMTQAHVAELIIGLVVLIVIVLGIAIYRSDDIDTYGDDWSDDE